MNILDAVCLTCKQPFGWLQGTPRWCNHCSEVHHSRAGRESRPQTADGEVVKVSSARRNSQRVRRKAKGLKS